MSDGSVNNASNDTGGIEVVEPQSVGLSPDRLARISRWMEAEVEAGRVAGATGMIARRGRTAYFETRGMANRETGRPMTRDTIFRIYSMTKPITSVALMMLYEEGLVRLHDAVSKYIPELGGLEVLIEDLSPGEYGMDGLSALGEVDASNEAAERESRREPSERDMTVQDLLRHTSGLTYGFFPRPQVDRMYAQAEVLGAKSLQDMVERSGRLPLKHQPGSTWDYSVSTDVLGRLVEVLSGKRFDEFLEDRVLGPLGMPDTAFFVSADKAERFAQLYAAAPEGAIAVADPSISERFVKEPTFLSGGGGLVSTTSDYLRFCQMMLNAGELDGVRLLSRKTVELMTRDHLGDVPRGRGSHGYGFGLGFAVAMDHTRSGLAGSEGEYYWGGMAGTGFWIDPKEDMIGIYMVQIFPSTGVDYRDQFKQLAYQTIAD